MDRCPLPLKLVVLLIYIGIHYFTKQNLLKSPFTNFSENPA
jgi:hypothetical protein